MDYSNVMSYLEEQSTVHVCVMETFVFFVFYLHLQCFCFFILIIGML